jgi:O-antigen/teichoic acid export membrane protein
VVIARSLGVDANGRYAGIVSIVQMLLVFGSFGIETVLNTYLPRQLGPNAAARARYIVRRALIFRLVLLLGLVIPIVYFLSPLLGVAETLLEYLWLMLILAVARSVASILAIVLTAGLRTDLTAKVNGFARLAELIAVIVLSQIGTSVSAIPTLAHIGTSVPAIPILAHIGTSVPAIPILAHIGTSVPAIPILAHIGTSVPAVSILAHIGTSVPAILIVMIGGALLQIGGYLLFSGAELRGPVEAVPLRPMVIFGGMFWINTAVDYFLGRQGDILFLTVLIPDPSQASFYDVAYSILQAGSMIATIGMSGVTLVAFSRLAMGEKETMNRFYESLVRITSLLVIPMLGLLYVTAPNVIRLLYDDAYTGAAEILRVMLGLRIAARLFGGGENADYLLSLDRVGALVRLGLAGAGVTIALHLLLIPRFGAVGAAWAGGVGAFTANLLALVQIRRIGAVRIQWRTWMALSGATIGGGLAAAILDIPGTPIVLILTQGAAFCTAMLFILVYFKPLEPQDALALSSMIGWIKKPLRWFTRQARNVG